jgi:branched-chain amino acid transport system substrate-binding protein
VTALGGSQRQLGEKMARWVGFVGLFVGSLALVVATATGAGALATGSGGNASGGRLAQVASKQKLAGPKGSGLTRGVTSSSITVGCVYTATDYSGFDAGLKARFARANKTGIDGRKISLVPCKDDADSVQTDVQDVQQLVNQNKVFSVFSLTEDILPGSTNFLNENQVPFYGWGFDPGFCGTRWGFGWNGCVSPNLLPSSNPLHNVESGNLATAILKATGMSASKVRFAAQADNTPAGQSANAGYASLFKALGSKVVYNKANFSSTGTTADYTPYVSAILASNPNVVYITTPFANIGGFVASLKAAGYKGVTLDFATYVPGLLASSPQLASALQGEYINNQTVPQEQSTPFVRQELKDFAAAGLPSNLTLGASIGYYEAEQFIDQLQAVGTTLNTKTFDAKVNGGTFTSYATVAPGGPGKLLWPAAHFLPADCAVILKVAGTSYKVVRPFQCYQSYNLGT